MNQFTSPIAKKLQIKPSQNWLLYNAPQNYLPLLEPLPEGTTIAFAPEGIFDGIQLFVVNNQDVINSLQAIKPLLKPGTILWITYPKKSSGIETDLEMMGNWDEPAKYGLRVVTAASVNETWTALRFKPEELTKLSETRKAGIKDNDYAAFIDVDNKQVKLPPEMQHVLTASAPAMNFYQSLSYSNKKEYVIWILSARQEKTKADRLNKLMEKLLAGKKNPAEK